MLELIKYIVEQFAEEKDAISYDVEETEDTITVTVLLAESDMGKVIGKQGKIAKALRTLVRAATPKGSKKYSKKYNVEGTRKPALLKGSPCGCTAAGRVFFAAKRPRGAPQTGAPRA